MSEDDDEGLTEAVLKSDLPVDEPFLNEIVNASDPDQSDDDEGISQKFRESSRKKF